MNDFHIDTSNMQAMIVEHFREVAYYMTRPSALFRPAISIDGNKWCALYGENLQDGVAGFGDSPAEAMADFDKAWATTLAPKALPSILSNKEERK